jgi:membrane associated rhomboid family serine protease
MLDPLETILRQCAAAMPHPWYPSGYAQANGLKRDDLDPYLDQLRMSGLIHLTDWVQGQGQGYALTPDGQRILGSPRELARLRAGKLDNSRSVLQEPPDLENRPVSAYERGEEIRAAFLHPSTPVVSYTLILFNIVWFLWGISIALQHGDKLNEFLFGSTPEVLRRTGALSGGYLIQGGVNWARLITCCFVHIGLLHLGVNMYSLWAVGPFFERLWGRASFLALYLIAGLGGSCAMVISNPHITGAGASGAIWGILAAHAVWIIANRRYLPPQLASQMLRQVLIVLVINIGITYGVPNISASAHFGGGAVGAVTAVLLNYRRFGAPLQRRLALLGLVAIPVLCVAAVAQAEKFDPRWQQPWFEQVEQLIEPHFDALQRQPHKIRSLQEVRDAVADFEKARVLLYDAVDQLQKGGPLQQQGLKGNRLEIVRALEQEAWRCEDAELRFIEPLLSEDVWRVRRIYEEEHEALAKRDETERTPEVVEHAISRVHEDQRQVQADLEVLRSTSPFHNPKLEKRRVARLDNLEESFRGWERTDQRMRKMARKAAPSERSEPN